MVAGTRLSRSRVLDVCEQIATVTDSGLPAAGSRALGLYKCVRLALRHNLTQQL